MERFQKLLRVAVRKVKGKSADLVRLGDPVGNFVKSLLHSRLREGMGQIPNLSESELTAN